MLNFHSYKYLPEHKKTPVNELCGIFFYNLNFPLKLDLNHKIKCILIFHLRIKFFSHIALIQHPVSKRTQFNIKWKL